MDLIVNFRTNAEDRERIRRRAAELGVDVSTLIRRLIARDLARAERERQRQRARAA